MLTIARIKREIGDKILKRAFRVSFIIFTCFIVCVLIVFIKRYGFNFSNSIFYDYIKESFWYCIKISIIYVIVDFLTKDKFIKQKNSDISK